MTPKASSLLFTPCHLYTAMELECLGGPCCGRTVQFQPTPHEDDGVILWYNEMTEAAFYAPAFLWRQGRGNCGIVLQWIP